MIKRRYLAALVLFATTSTPCLADIFGFVDQDGKAYFSDRQLDSRYKLYMKTKPPVAPAAPQAIADAGRNPAAAYVQTAAAGRTLRRPYAEMITKIAHEHQMDPALIHAVVTVESAYNPRAKSRAGATGLMQLMPDTAKRYGVTDIHDPQQNLSGGTRYLRDLLAMFNNNLRLAIAAYNAGEGAVMKSGNAIPPYAETRAYVPKVLHHYERYRAASYRAS